MVAGIWKPDLGGLAGNLLPGLPTTMGDVYDAAYADGLTGHSVLARQFALEQAIDEKNDKIKAATGVALPNPTRAAVDYETPQEGVDEDAARNWADYRRQLGELRDRFPERFDILADFDENELAKAQTRANDKRLGEVSAMGPGGGATFMASLAGGFVASLRDPPQLIANILAPGAGFGKSLLYHGVKSAVINATVEAGIQPFVQSWRKEAGVESGFGEAMKDILMAGVAGGAIDVVGRGAFRAAKVYRGGKWVDDPTTPAAPGADPAAPPRVSPDDVGTALDDASKRLPEDHPIRQAAEGRPEALVREVEKLGDQATPELRALAQRAEAETLFGPPDGMDEVRHIEGLAQAIRNAVAPEIEPPGFSGARSPELARMVDGGLVPEDLAALVARSSPMERQADLAQLLLDRAPASPDAARRILAEELSKPVARVGESRGLSVEAVDEQVRIEQAGPYWKQKEADLTARLEARLGERGLGDGLERATFGDFKKGARLLDDEIAIARAEDPDIVPALEAMRDPAVQRDLENLARVQAIREGTIIPQDMDFPPRSSSELMASLRGFDETRLGARGFEEPRGEGAKLQTEALVRDVQSRIDAVRELNAAAAKPRAAPEAGDAAPRATPPRAYAPEFLAREADVEAALVKVAQRLPKAVRVQLERNIQIGRYELDGYWDRRNNVLAVALDKGVDAANGTMRHEEIHALRHFGLFTDREWGLLTERATKLGIRRDIGLDGLAEYRDMYVPMVAKDMIRGRGWNEAADLPWPEIKRSLGLKDGDEIAGLQRLGLWDEGRLQALLDEEAVAELASRRRAGDSFGSRLDKVIDRIAEFLEATANALRGLGFDTADAVFRRIETGEVGVRFRQPSDVTLPGGAKVRGIDIMAAIRAYHGSPHDFDRFDLGKIGTGEGAQAYGHGLYFAEREGVAKSYRDALGSYDGVAKWRGDGQPTPRQAQLMDLLRGQSEHGGAQNFRTLRTQLETTRDDALRLAARGRSNMQPLADEMAVLLKELDSSASKIELTPPGRLYEVNIKANPDDFLDWDKPLSQQSEKVRAALTAMNLGNPEYLKYGGADLWPTEAAARSTAEMKGVADAKIVQRKMWNGETGYSIVVERPVGENIRSTLQQGQTVEMLREQGIAGVRYLDQSSRSVGDGTRNYVVFDDKLIEIVAKDGQPFERELARADLDAEGAKLVDACKLGAG